MEFKPIIKATDTTIPVNNGQMVVDARDATSSSNPAEGISIDFNGVRKKVAVSPDDLNNAVSEEAGDRQSQIEEINNVLAGIHTTSLAGAFLTRTLNGTTGVARSLFDPGEVFTTGKTLIFDEQGTLGVYIGDVDAATIEVLTKTISPLGSDISKMLGNVSTNSGSAGFPQTVTDAETKFGRTPHVDDRARTVTSAGVVTEWNITGIDTSGNISWGNPLNLGVGTYQAQSAAGDAGRLLTGGATAGTFGDSAGIDNAPTQNSSNLVSSGGVFANTWLKNNLQFSLNGTELTITVTP